MDSGPVVAVLGLAALQAGWRRDGRTVLWWLVGPFVVIVGAWLMWKVSYYGSIFPNTLTAKEGGQWSLRDTGALLIWRFLHWYLWWPFLALGTVGLLVRRRFRDVAILPWSLIGIWLVYIVAIGGDFMEFRPMMPIAPFLAIALAQCITTFLGRDLLRHATLTSLVTLAVLGAASWRHAHTFEGTLPDQTLDSIPALSDFYGTHGRRCPGARSEPRSVMPLPGCRSPLPWIRWAPFPTTAD